MTESQGVFGHPKPRSKDACPLLTKGVRQCIDYKSVGSYRKFFGDNAWSPILCNYALCPQTRAALWLQHQRELSLLKFARHFQALAAHWLQAIFQSACKLYRFLQRACATATRLAAKAARKRRTTAQILQEDIRCSLESGALAITVNA
mgnify:CR=1 FL=1